MAHTTCPDASGGRQARGQFCRSAWRRKRGYARLIKHGVLVVFACVVTGCVQNDPHSAQHANTPSQLQGETASQRSAGGWLSFGNEQSDQALGPSNADESALSLATVNRLQRGWQVKLPDLADERPIFVSQLAWPDRTVRDVLYLTADNGTLLALDATTGAHLWTDTPKTAPQKYTKSSPAADPATGLIYSYSLDGTVHRYRLTTGQEVPGDGWPVRVTKMPLSEKVSSALRFANGYLYVTTASFSGDAPPYQGHLVTINTKTGATHVFNSLCHDHPHLLAQGECTENGGGIWGRPGVVVDPVTGNIFFAVSDGRFTANTGGADWGDSVIEMTPDGGTIVDSYTPTNYATEAFQNRDLGSVLPVLLPPIPQSRTPLLVVQAGKEGMLRVLNRHNLSGQGQPGHVGGELQQVTVPNDCPVLAQPVAGKEPGSNALMLYVATSCQMDAYQVLTSAQGATTLQLAWSVAAQTSSPILVGGVLFAASSMALQALDPRTGQTLWNSALASAKGSIGGIHWESPIVVGGRVYCTDENDHLTMYQLP